MCAGSDGGGIYNGRLQQIRGTGFVHNLFTVGATINNLFTVGATIKEGMLELVIAIILILILGVIGVLLCLGKCSFLLGTIRDMENSPKKTLLTRVCGIVLLVIVVIVAAAVGVNYYRSTCEPEIVSIERLKELNGGSLPKIEYDEAGHIIALEGIISDYEIKDEEDMLRAFEGVKSIFTIDNSDYTFESYYQKQRGDLLLNITEFYKDAFVTDAIFQMIVDSDDNRTVTITNNFFYGCEQIDLSSIITAEQAKESVSDYRNGEVAFCDKDPLLLITDINYENLKEALQDPDSKVETAGRFPVWDVYIKADGGYEEIYVDALTAEILSGQFRAVE